MRALRAGIIIALFALAGLITAWQITGFGLGHWMQVHLGITDEPGPYYGFFSGSGSDLGEVALIGGLATLIAGLGPKIHMPHRGGRANRHARGSRRGVRRLPQAPPGHHRPPAPQAVHRVPDRGSPGPH